MCANSGPVPMSFLRSNMPRVGKQVVEEASSASRLADSNHLAKLCLSLTHLNETLGLEAA